MLTLNESVDTNKNEEFEKFISLMDNIKKLPSDKFIMVNEYKQKNRSFFRKIFGNLNDIDKMPTGNIYEEYISLAQVINKMFKFSNTIIEQKESFVMPVDFDTYNSMVIKTGSWESIHIDCTDTPKLCYGDYSNYEKIKDKVFDLARVMFCYKTFIKLVKNQKFIVVDNIDNIVKSNVYFCIENNNISKNNYPTFRIYLGNFGSIEVSMVGKKIKVNSFSICLAIDKFLKKNYNDILSNCYIPKSNIANLLDCFENLEEAVDYISKK